MRHVDVDAPVGLGPRLIEGIAGAIPAAEPGVLRAADSVGNIEGLIGNAFGRNRSYAYSWNTITYAMGSHDQCGNLDNGRGDKRHFVARFGGRGNCYARAKARMAWALNVASNGTPMLFMGSECHLDGYWHDGPDINATTG